MRPHIWDNKTELEVTCRTEWTGQGKQSVVEATGFVATFPRAITESRVPAGHTTWGTAPDRVTCVLCHYLKHNRARCNSLNHYKFMSTWFALLNFHWRFPSARWTDLTEMIAGWAGFHRGIHELDVTIRSAIKYWTGHLYGRNKVSIQDLHFKHLSCYWGGIRERPGLVRCYMGRFKGG